MPLIEGMKRSGLKRDPQGTPDRTEVGLDMWLPIFTACVCPLSYELNQEYGLGGTVG